MTVWWGSGAAADAVAGTVGVATVALVAVCALLPLLSACCLLQAYGCWQRLVGY